MRLSPARLLEERPGTLLAALTLLAKMHDAKPEKGCRRTLRLRSQMATQPVEDA